MRAQLYAAYDIGYLNLETFTLLNQRALECSRLIARFIRGLKVSKFQGLQYKREQKKDPWLRDFIHAQGNVFTARGVMEKEEAEKLGLKEINF